MSFYVESNQERQFKNVPAGSHLGRCYRIVDLGSQKVEYMGETKVQRKIMLSWELFGQDDEGADLVTDDGKPMAIFKNYTLSWSENANLRKTRGCRCSGVRAWVEVGRSRRLRHQGDGR